MDNVTLISGASRGIGRAIAEKFASLGDTVIGTATSQAGADAITQYLSDINAKGAGMVLDVTSEESVKGLIEGIKSDFGQPGILINNAGITDDTLFLRMSEASFDKVMQANLYGTFRLTKGCIKGMVKARYGRIINISSVVAFSGNAGQVNYSASKSALLGMTKSLAQELANRNITVNLVAPGFIETDMTDKLDDAHRSKLVDNIPVSRIGKASDIAAAVAFLASEDAGYITGETIHVNGGLLMS